MFGFMSIICMVAAGEEAPATAKATGTDEKPRMVARKPGDKDRKPGDVARKPDEESKPSAVQPGSMPAVQRKPTSAKTSAAGARAKRRPAAHGTRRGAPVVGRQHGRMRRNIEAGRMPMTPAERRLMDAVEDAESSRELSRLMSRVLASQNSEVRQAMVDALEDQGLRSINDLAYFIADPDREVADSAFSAWASVLDDLGPSHRVAAIQTAAQILQQQPSGLQQ